LLKITGSNKILPGFKTEKCLKTANGRELLSQAVK